LACNRDTVHVIVSDSSCTYPSTRLSKAPNFALSIFRREAIAYTSTIASAVFLPYVDPH